MKRKSVVTLLSLAAMNVAAQDIIVMRNGDEVEAKVTKVGTTEVEYHKWSNIDGPLYTVAKSDVFMVKYRNGDKDVFTNSERQPTPQQSSKASGPQYIKKSPANNNQQLIDRYKTPVKFAKMPSDKDAKYFFPIMAMSDSSIVSTSDIEMKIIPTIVDWLHLCFYNIKYYIELQNKTDKIIYIDLATTIRINHDGTSKSYYNSEQITINEGSSSGVGVNLGGVANVLGIGGALGSLAGSTTIGGSNQNTTSTTYANQRILAIPPHSKRYLTEFKKKDYQIISDIESYNFIENDLRGQLKKDGIISYSEENSPYKVTYMITYSTAQDFSEFSSLYAKLYSRYVYGLVSWSFSGPDSQEKLIRNIQKIIPNFWEDSGIIVGRINDVSKKK